MCWLARACYDVLWILASFIFAERENSGSLKKCLTDAPTLTAVFRSFFQFISPTISIAVLTVISIDRYFSLARPILSKAPRLRIFRPNWLLSFAWLYSTLQFLPTFYFSSLVPIDITNSTRVYYCTPIPNKSQSGKIYLILLFFASFIVPVSTMSVLYYRVARVVWDRKKRLSVVSVTSQNVQNSKIMEGSRKKVVRMLLIVVAVFFICWTPFVVYSGFLEQRLKGFPNPMDAVRLGLYGLGLSNSICNPFIYYFNGNFNLRVLFEKERRARSPSASSLSYYNLKIQKPRSLSSATTCSQLMSSNDNRKQSCGWEGRSRAFSTLSAGSMHACTKLDEPVLPVPSPKRHSRETHLW